MWKYGISPYHNNTDKNWVNVKDSTWTNIVAPTGLAYNMRKTVVPNCRPGGCLQHPVSPYSACPTGQLQPLS